MRAEYPNGVDDWRTTAGSTPSPKCCHCARADGVGAGGMRAAAVELEEMQELLRDEDSVQALVDGGVTIGDLDGLELVAEEAANDDEDADEG